MAAPTNDELNDVTFESGVNANGTVADPSFASWNGNTPATYTTTQGFAYKWDNNAAGQTIASTSAADTPGGTVTYTFGSGVTAAQQQAFESTLTLWSDEANISFAPAGSASTADLVLNVTTTGGTDNLSPPQQYSVAGSKVLPTAIDPSHQGGGQDTITFNNNGDYGTLGSFSDLGGYGESALTHEVGHMLGLGHSGPYDDGASGSNEDASQFNEYDSRQWSVMSYIQPDDTNAAYYGQYTVTGTNWANTTTVTNPNGSTTKSTVEVAPETPMMDDILSAQRLYGAATTGALTQAQTFGFNCTINDGSRPFFDFTTNTNPVITIYDSSPSGSTLDCSGFKTNCTINLNPGTFSTASAGTLTNNIGIAFGTKVDTAIGGTGNDTFTVNTDSDTINGGAGTNTVDFGGAAANYSVASAGAETLVTNKSTGDVDTLSNVQTLDFSDKAVALCFAAGTRIRTVGGDKPVEALAPGDLVVTVSGATRAVVWLGGRYLDGAGHALPSQQWPVRVRAGAFGPGLPVRDLRLSPGHPVLVGAGPCGEDGHLVPIMCLINGTTISREPCEHVTYWHVELDRHDILLAESLPAESYIDLGSRAWFDRADDPLHDPDSVFAHAPGRCRPLALDGFVVETARRTLDAALDATLHGHCGWTDPGSVDRLPAW